MATVGKVNGTAILLFVEGTAIACLTSNNISLSHAPRETTNKDSGGNKESLEGMNSWSGGGEGFFAEDSPFGFEDLWDLWKARGIVTVKESSGVTGDIEYSGSAFITALERSSPLEETVTFTISFEGTGEMTKATIV